MSKKRIKNENLVRAKIAKNDEYYTRLEDIERELSQYLGAFAGKDVYLPCDSASKSMFWKYFRDHALDLRWNSVTATCRHLDGQGEHSIMTSHDGEIVSKTTCLEGDGDFLSDECLNILDGADIVVTNLPFSMFRKYVRTMMTWNKDFIVIGGKNGGKYQDTIEYVMDGRMRLGFNDGHGTMLFDVPDEGTAAVGAYWYTTLPSPPRRLALVEEYDPDVFPKYANYDAIEVSRVADIPRDYRGKMGVPITFLEYFDPDQWVLHGTNATVLENAPQDPHIKARSHLYRRQNLYLEQKDGTFKRMYDRLIISRRIQLPPGRTR